MGENNNVRRRRLTVTGSPYEIGYQHGLTFRKEITQLLNDNVARVNYLRNRTLTLADALSQASSCARYIEEQTPKIADEIAGLAKGAGITYLEAVLLQIRRELIHGTSLHGDCTSWGFNDGGKVGMAQTIDLAGGMSEFLLILNINPLNTSSPRVCMFTFTGLCGYLGFNSSGIAIGLNMIYCARWRAGVPAYLLIRHLLSKHSIAEILEEIPKIHRASSRYLMIGDARHILGIEMTIDEYRILTDSPVVHSNHFLHPDLVSYEEMNGKPLLFSHRRLERLRTLLQSGTSPAEIFKDHEGYPQGICEHGTNMRGVNTVGATVIYPGDRRMLAMLGRPCQEEFEEYRLD
jgi:isopenicillin-N N-acyltransferase-like protein